VFTFMVVYHVGSRNEAPGNTGSAHLLEHMIFNKSTENFGKARGRPTFQDSALRSRRRLLVVEHDDVVRPHERLLDAARRQARARDAHRGRPHAARPHPRQRAASPRCRWFATSTRSARTTRRERCRRRSSAPAIQAHPYHWDTIGYDRTSRASPPRSCAEHYRAFFHPDNSEAILAGDFDVDSALALFDREFGAFPKAARPIPQVITTEPAQEGERRVVVKRQGNTGLVALAYLRPGASHADFFAFEVLASVLGDGVNARLYQALVERGLATSVNADNYALRDPYRCSSARPARRASAHAEVEAAPQGCARPRSPTRASRGRAQARAAADRGGGGALARWPVPRRIVARRGGRVGRLEGFLTYVDRIKAVGADDVRRVAATYLAARSRDGGLVRAGDDCATASAPPASDAAARPASAATALAPTATAPVANTAAAAKTTAPTGRACAPRRRQRHRVRCPSPPARCEAFSPTA
jgi:zinc protease